MKVLNECLLLTNCNNHESSTEREGVEKDVMVWEVLIGKQSSELSWLGKGQCSFTVAGTARPNLCGFQSLCLGGSGRILGLIGGSVCMVWPFLSPEKLNWKGEMLLRTSLRNPVSGPDPRCQTGNWIEILPLKYLGSAQRSSLFSWVSSGLGFLQTPYTLLQLGMRAMRV